MNGRIWMLYISKLKRLQHYASQEWKRSGDQLTAILIMIESLPFITNFEMRVMEVTSQQYTGL